MSQNPRNESNTTYSSSSSWLPFPRNSWRGPKELLQQGLPWSAWCFLPGCIGSPPCSGSSSLALAGYSWLLFYFLHWRPAPMAPGAPWLGSPALGSLYWLPPGSFGFLPPAGCTGCSWFLPSFLASPSGSPGLPGGSLDSLVGFPWFP